MTTNNINYNTNSNLEMAQGSQDFIIAKGKRKKHTWLIAGVICTAIIILIVLIYFLTKRNNNDNNNSNNDHNDAEPLSLEDILYGRTSPNSFNATWISRKELMYSDYHGNLVLYDVESKTTNTLLPSNDSILIGAHSFQISADKNYVLVAYSYQKIYRHSHRAKYTIIDLNNTTRRTQLKFNDYSDFLFVKWAPVGNALAFVFENNIFYKNEAFSDKILQITNDNGFIFNGVTDWVYEEEIFNTNEALWFSPDGKILVFGKFDDSKTPYIVLPIYGEPGNAIFQYPRAQRIIYPKVGTPNPVVGLYYVELASVNLIKKLEIPVELTSQSPILATVSWATNTTLSAIWMNRVQNKASLVSYTMEAPFPMEVIKSFYEPSGWLDLFTPPLYSNDGSKLVMILSQHQSNETGAYRHIVLLKRQSNTPIEAVTHGNFVVTKILGWNSESDEIYYTANAEHDPAIQHVYSISISTKQTKCYSCGIRSKDNTTECLYNNAEFSQDSSYFVLFCGGPGIPYSTLYSTTEMKKIVDWEDNPHLTNLTTTKTIPKIMRMAFKVDGNFTAQVLLKLPPNIDTSGNTKYPLLVNVYAGPDSYQVTEKFNLGWESYLATNKNIIYAGIDGRGSGLKGDRMMFTNYRRLGTDEIVDQINVTKQLQKNLPYIDAKRTAIWGWSYGGYASAMALATDKENVFKCGMSVAPVTDWRLYDSIYTERFMGLPTIEDNFQGYRNANLLTKYEGIRGKPYFLIHGTYDDNVHYQQSMLWARVLEQNDILFRQLSYPDQDHALGSVRPHLYHSLEDFLDECFAETDN